MIHLTEEQARQLTNRTPVAIDPLTGDEYVLIRRSAYEHMQRLIADDMVLATGELVDRIMAEDDANDPHLSNERT